MHEDAWDKGFRGTGWGYTPPPLAYLSTYAHTLVQKSTSWGGGKELGIGMSCFDPPE